MGYGFFAVLLIGIEYISQTGDKTVVKGTL